MIFGRKDAVSKANNWLSGNSLLTLRKRRTRNIARKNELSGTKQEELNKYQLKRPFLAKLFQFRRKATTNISPRDHKQKPVFSSHKNSSNNSNISNTGTLPLWILKLHQTNRYSSVITFLLVLSTLTVYSLTVYSQELWSESYKKLQSLQRHERQLNTANATLTSTMAEDGEKPNTELVSPNSEGAIFINPLPENLPKPSTSNETKSTSESESPTSLGY